MEIILSSVGAPEGENFQTGAAVFDRLQKDGGGGVFGEAQMN